MTAEDLIREAKQQAFTHLGPQKISTSALLSHLSTLDREITELVSQIAPQMLTEQERTLTVTDSQNQEGYRLKDAVSYRNFTLEDENDNRVPISLVPQDEKHTSEAHPAAVIEKARASTTNKLFPVDPRHENWEGTEEREWFSADDSHKIHYTYIPQPGRLSKLSDELVSPPEAFSYFVAALATQISLIQSAPNRDIELAMRRERELRANFLMQMYKRVKMRSAAFSDTAGDSRFKSLFRELHTAG